MTILKKCFNPMLYSCFLMRTLLFISFVCLLSIGIGRLAGSFLKKNFVISLLLVMESDPVFLNSGI